MSDNNINSNASLREAFQSGSYKDTHDDCVGLWIWVNKELKKYE